MKMAGLNTGLYGLLRLASGDTSAKESSSNGTASIASRLDPVSLYSTLAEWGTYLLLFALPLTVLPISDEMYGVPKITVVRVFTILILALLALRALHTGNLVIPRTPLDWPLLAFVAVALIASAQGVSWGAAILGPNVRSDGLLTFVNAAILCYVAAGLLRDATKVRRALCAASLASLLISVEAIAEFFNRSLIGQPSGYFAYRPMSTLGNPDFLGGYLVMIVPLTAALVMMSARKWARALWSLTMLLSLVVIFFSLTRAAWVSLIVLAPVYVIIERKGIWARRAWFVGVALALALVIALTEAGTLVQLRAAESKSSTVPAAQATVPVDQAAATSATGGGAGQTKASGTGNAAETVRVGPGQSDPLAIAANVNSFGGSERLRSIVNFQEGGSGRLIFWRIALNLIADHPLLGTGYASMYAALTRYYTLDWVRMSSGLWLDKSHNELLDVAIQTGLVGLAIYLWLLGTFAVTVYRAYRRGRLANEPPKPGRDIASPKTGEATGRGFPDNHLLVAIAFGWLGYLAQSMFLFGTVDTIPTFWMLAGMGLSAASAVDTRSIRWNFKSGVAVRNGIYALVLASAGFLLYLSALPLVSEIYLARAGDARLRHDMGSAMSYYLKAASLAPNNQDTVVKAAQALAEIASITPDARSRRHLLDESVLLWNDAVDSHPRFANLYLLRAETYARYGDDHVIDAFNDFKRAVELYPLYARALAGVADMGHMLGRQDEAIVAERRLLVIDPNKEDTLASLAEDYFAARRWSEAIATWKKVEQFDGESADLHYWIAQAYLAGGKSREAQEELQAALRLNPEHAPAQDALKRLRDSHN